MSGMSGAFFSVFPILFFIVFAFVLSMILRMFVRGFRRERINDRSPRLTVQVKIVAKRTQVRGNASSVHTAGSAYTHYFSTFEFASGDRLELAVPADAYGYLVEGDEGNLTFQGTRFLSFDR